MMGQNKFFILGLDGLEHNFIEKWDLRHLKQKECGRIKVPINEKTGVPLTPEVWASFLTGKRVKTGFINVSPPLETVFKLLKFMRRRINLSLGLGMKIRENVPQKWWSGFHIGFPHLRLKTFLDLTDSKEVNAPYYSYDGAALDIIRHFGTGKVSLEQTIEMFKALCEKRKKQILYETKDFDVFFAYMHFPDVLQHLLFTRPSKIKEHYFDLDRFVYEVKNRVEGSFFLIVSDHGFNLESGEHSRHGFYSSNIALNPKPMDITDFFSILEEK